LHGFDIRDKDAPGGILEDGFIQGIRSERIFVPAALRHTNAHSRGGVIISRELKPFITLKATAAH
jgi:hypothetical protein